MADRLISADALKSRVLQGQFKIGQDGTWYVLGLIDSAPTAEAVSKEDYMALRVASQMAVDNLRAEIERLKAEAEPIKHGKWEMYGAITRGTLAIPIYRCSECKEDTNNWFWHYCPHCGARMDESEWKEPEINPCRGCRDYDGKGGCISNGGCGAKMDLDEVEE